MGEAAQRVAMPPEEYLAFERASDVKHEYIDGDIFAMAGAPEDHNLIVTNLAAELRAALRERCRVYPSDMKVWVEMGNRYLYPDVTVACAPRFKDDKRDLLLNPTVIIEVLSDSTEAYDRGDKFEQYQSLPSLAEYALVSHRHQRVDHYTRKPEGTWLLRVFGPGSRVAFPVCGCDVAMEEIYLNVAESQGRP
jgi:Uma2 family endonuclease